MIQSKGQKFDTTLCDDNTNYRFVLQNDVLDLPVFACKRQDIVIDTLAEHENSFHHSLSRHWYH